MPRSHALRPPYTDACRRRPHTTRPAARPGAVTRMLDSTGISSEDSRPSVQPHAPDSVHQSSASGLGSAGGSLLSWHEPAIHPAPQDRGLFLVTEWMRTRQLLLPSPTNLPHKQAPQQVRQAAVPALSPPIPSSPVQSWQPVACHRIGWTIAPGGWRHNSRSAWSRGQRHSVASCDGNVKVNPLSGPVPGACVDTVKNADS